MSRSRVDLLLSVAMSDQETKQDRLDRSLGVLWDVADLSDIVATPAGKSSGPSQIDPTKTHVRVPLGLAVSGEFFAKLAEPYQAAKKKKEEVAKTLAGEGFSKGFIDVGQLSPAEAKAFWKNLK